MLDLSHYLLSAVGLLVTVVALAWGAARVRGRLLPGWSGMPALLADAVITVALLIWTAELLGAVGMLKAAPLIFACVAVGLALRLAVSAPGPGAGMAPPAPGAGRWGPTVAAAIAATVFAHWAIGTVTALQGGMTGYDSAWYHMPFAAHFAQSGSTLDFALVSPRYLSWFYPANSELLHGVGIVLFQRDILSPLLNMLWLGGCLVAAWCIGRPYGAGPWTLAAAAVLLDAGMMADQAGEARNDTLGLFLLLAAVAFLLNGAGERPVGRGPLAVAGLSVGLAAGTKLSFVAPGAALLIGVPVLAAAGRRRAAVIAFAAPMLAGCAFWYLRNLALAGNPLPWFRALGPLRLDGPEQGLGGRPQFSVLHYIGDGRIWSDWFGPGLSHRLGELWPLLLLAAALAVLLCLARGPGALRLVAFAAAVGAAVYLLDGTSAEGPAGMPVGFASSLRHLLPALCLALLLVPLAPGMRSGRGRVAAAVLLGALLVAADRSADPWRPGYIALAAGATAAAVSASLMRTTAPRGLPRPAIAAAVVTAVGALIAAGWTVQRSYLRDRYVGHDFRSAGLNAAFAWAAHQREERIATTLPLQYPLLGRDLSNRVAFVGRRGEDAGYTAIRHCRPWRAALAAGDYGFVVTAGGAQASRDGSGHCLARDPQARPVLQEDRIAIYRLDVRADAARRPQASRRLSERRPRSPS